MNRPRSSAITSCRRLMVIAVVLIASLRLCTTTAKAGISNLIRTAVQDAEREGNEGALLRQGGSLVKRTLSESLRENAELLPDNALLLARENDTLVVVPARYSHGIAFANASEAAHLLSTLSSQDRNNPLNIVVDQASLDSEDYKDISVPPNAAMKALGTDGQIRRAKIIGLPDGRARLVVQYADHLFAPVEEPDAWKALAQMRSQPFDAGHVSVLSLVTDTYTNKHLATLPSNLVRFSATDIAPDRATTFKRLAEAIKSTPGTMLYVLAHNEDGIIKMHDAYGHILLQTDISELASLAESCCKKIVFPLTCESATFSESGVMQTFYSSEAIKQLRRALLAPTVLDFYDRLGAPGLDFVINAHTVGLTRYYRMQVIRTPRSPPNARIGTIVGEISFSSMIPRAEILDTVSSSILSVLATLLIAIAAGIVSVRLRRIFPLSILSWAFILALDLTLLFVAKLAELNMSLESSNENDEQATYGDVVSKTWRLVARNLIFLIIVAIFLPLSAIRYLSGVSTEEQRNQTTNIATTQ